MSALVGFPAHGGGVWGTHTHTPPPTGLRYRERSRVATALAFPVTLGLSNDADFAPFFSENWPTCLTPPNLGRRDLGLPSSRLVA